MLLGRTSDWFPALRPFVLIAGVLGVAAILALPLLRRIPKLAIGLVAVLGLGAALAAPLFSTVATAATPHSGAIPSVTPTPAGGQGGPGGFAGGFAGGGRGSATPSAAASPAAKAASRAALAAATGSRVASPAAGSRVGGWHRRQHERYGQRQRFLLSAVGSAGRGAGGAGGGGGFLDASQSNAALNRLLQGGASRYTWAAATVNSNNAAGYQLASGEPIMAIGGFNGTDPAPTLAQFEKYVSEGKIHYFIAGGGGGFAGRGGFGGPTAAGAAGGSSSGDDASQITSWVESHFTAQSVGGVSVYNLTSSS